MAIEVDPSATTEHCDTAIEIDLHHEITQKSSLKPNQTNHSKIVRFWTAISPFEPVGDFERYGLPILSPKLYNLTPFFYYSFLFSSHWYIFSFSSGSNDFFPFSPFSSNFPLSCFLIDATPFCFFYTQVIRQTGHPISSLLSSLVNHPTLPLPSLPIDMSSFTCISFHFMYQPYHHYPHATNNQAHHLPHFQLFHILQHSYRSFLSLSNTFSSFNQSFDLIASLLFFLCFLSYVPVGDHYRNVHSVRENVVSR